MVFGLFLSGMLKVGDFFFFLTSPLAVYLMSTENVFHVLFLPGCFSVCVTPTSGERSESGQKIFMKGAVTRGLRCSSTLLPYLGVGKTCTNWDAKTLMKI